MNLSLAQTDDILALLGKQKKNQVLVGFAAETEHLLESADRKLKEKNLDFLVANDVSRGVFGEDVSSVVILRRSGESIAVNNQSKPAIAGAILDLALEIRNQRPGIGSGNA
jgi:phosphopantothenoylcysteine decarboxylase/phosphopantothenate--cysteine ligase